MSFFGKYIIVCNSTFTFNRVAGVGKYRKTHYTRQKTLKKNLGHRGKKWSYVLPQYYSLIIESCN